MERKRILVVDDEATIRDLLKLNLELEGYEVITAASGEEVLRMGNALTRCQLVLLDVMMEDIDGFAVARALREDASTARIPIIFCTARTHPDDEIRGLELGGEDYITKPFTMRTLLARVRRTLQRITEEEAVTSRSSDSPSILSAEGVTLDPASKTVMVDGSAVALTPNEWGLLQMLMSHPGQVFSRTQLLKAIRGDGVYITERTIDVNVAHLRRKLGSRASIIATRPGFGYLLAVTT